MRRSDGDIFDTVEISFGQGPLLILKLIGVDILMTSEVAKKEVISYKATQLEIRAKGLSSVILWEDLWLTKQVIVKSRLEALLGISQTIPGRLTVVRRIDKKTALGFLNANHLQGSVSSKTQYGLYLPNRYYRVLDSQAFIQLPDNELLVAVATFSYPRIFQKVGEPYRSYEMIRFSSLIHTTVVGGINKLISAFVKDFHPGDLMTYADLEWSDGASYRKLGFQEISETAPMMYWLDPISMTRFGQKYLDEQSGHYIEIYNQGSRKFVRTFAVGSQ